MRHLLLVAVLSGAAFGQMLSLTGSAPAAAAPSQPNEPDTSTVVTTANTLPDLPPPPKGKATVIGGMVRSVDRVRDQMTVDVFSGKPMKILFDERTQVYRDGLKGSLVDLQNGEHVSVETVLDETSVFARSVHMLTRSPEGECSGQVLNFDRAKGELWVHDPISPNPIKLQLSASTSIVWDGQAAASAGDVQVGSLVSVKFQPGDGGKRFIKQIAILANPGASFVFSGNVSFLDLHTGLLVVVDPRDQKRYELYFDRRLPGSAQLHDGTDVTVTAGFNGERYTAKSIAINSTSAK